MLIKYSINLEYITGSTGPMATNNHCRAPVLRWAHTHKWAISIHPSIHGLVLIQQSIQRNPMKTERENSNSTQLRTTEA